MKIKFLILLLFPSLSFSQLSVAVDSVFNNLRKTNQVQNDFIGMSSDATVYVDYESRYNKIDSLATDEEILFMAEKGNNVIKRYMSGILIDRKSKYLGKLFEKYLYNDEEYHVQAGCTGYEESHAGYLYSMVFYQNEKIESVKYFTKRYTAKKAKEYSLEYETKWTKPEVDSLVISLNKATLSNDNVLPITLRKIFTVNRFKFDNYERVRYFANKYPSEVTLATLASFQNKNDLPLLHQNIEKSYLAISRFPDASFIPELKARVRKTLYNYEYLDAVAGFKIADASELVSMVMEEFETARDQEKRLAMNDGERLNHFYNCLEKNGSAFSDAFLLTMWLKHKIISFTFFQKIKDTHYNEILEGFMNNLPIETAPVNQNVDLSSYSEEQLNGYLCPQILRYLKKNASRKQNKTINLQESNCNH